MRVNPGVGNTTAFAKTADNLTLRIETAVGLGKRQEITQFIFSYCRSVDRWD